MTETYAFGTIVVVMGFATVTTTELAGFVAAAGVIPVVAVFCAASASDLGSLVSLGALAGAVVEISKDPGTVAGGTVPVGKVLAGGKFYWS